MRQRVVILVALAQVGAELEEVDGAREVGD